MDTDAVLDLLKETAAAVITPRFRALADEHVIEKSPGDLVTIADRESEVLIGEALQKAYPDALVLGEEATAADPRLLERFRDAERTFTVDPVDGTKNFVHGSPDHAVMTAELHRGDVVRAWIWQPEHGVAYVAERGAGAYRNGERITRPEPAGAAPQLRGASSAHKLRRRLPEGLTIGDSWFCAGVDYSHLADGDIDYLVYKRDWPWDHAPGSLLVSEVGGVTGRLDGGAYDPRHLTPWLVSAASPQAFEEVRRRLQPVLG